MCRFQVLAVIGVLASLTACLAPRAKLSKEEVRAQVIAAFNVYENNLIGLKGVDQCARVTWYWTSYKDRILGFEINGKLYNARDLVDVTSDDTIQRGVKKITAHFKNGDVQSALAGYGWISERGEYGYYGPNWAACSRQKRCHSWNVISHVDSRASLDQILTAIDDNQLHREPFTESSGLTYAADDRAIPRSTAFTRLTALTDAEREQLRAEIAAEQGRRDAYAEALQAVRLAKEAAIIAEAQQMRRTVRVGTRTNCGLVFEVRLPMVGVQTSIGMQFLPIDELYGPSVTCRFFNGNYIGR